MNNRPERNAQKPWFMSNVWQQMVARPKQMQKDVVLKPSEGEHSQIYSKLINLFSQDYCQII